jgi:SNF2 family DNA or RNA helicase
MINFRKLKQDFSPAILKEGKVLQTNHKILAAKIIRFDPESIRCTGKVLGNFDNTYETEIEIDRFESQAIHTNCDCPSRYDCVHLAALIFHLEDKIDALIIEYSKEEDIAKNEQFDQEEKQKILEEIKEAKEKEVIKQDARYQKQLLQEYVAAAEILSRSSFFLPQRSSELTSAELSILFNPQTIVEKKNRIEFQLSCRLPQRSKPLLIPNLKHFLDAVRYEEPIFLGGKSLHFSKKSFDERGSLLIQLILDHVRFPELMTGDRAQRTGQLDLEVFGLLLAKMHESALLAGRSYGFQEEEEMPIVPGLFLGSLETPLRYSPVPAHFRFCMEYIEPPAAKLLLRSHVVLSQHVLSIEEVILFTCAQPGMLYQDTYYRFAPTIKRIHLLHLANLHDLTIPEPLFGSFVENALPQLRHYAEVANVEVIEQFVTLPYVGSLDVRCKLSYLDGELEAALFFYYDGHEVPMVGAKLGFEDIKPFVTQQGIVARNLVEERKILEDLFSEFTFNPQTETYFSKTEKKIVEFMTSTIPRNQGRVQFECPQNLLDQFIYDETTFRLSLDASQSVGYYEIDLKVEGALRGVKLEVLWECIGAKRSYLEIDATRQGSKNQRFAKILVLDLERITRLVQLFDELGIKKLDDRQEQKPLWNLVTIDSKTFEGLPVTFTMSPKLLQIRAQMLGETILVNSPVPKEINAALRPYQLEGVHWLERLRMMFLNGILADDMGLGKTVQAIVAITQHHRQHPNSHSLIVCPTSLLYNWKEEIHKFNPRLTVLIIDGVPSNRKKLLTRIPEVDIAITSYTLLQKDIEIYNKHLFAYAILDEAQHIKNRGTRNAKSVKMIQATHRLILTGTPIENSLEELWSLMDFLMPGFLSSFDRFIEKYIRADKAHVQNIEYLRRKVSPFILRRMKTDVLKDLPPVSEIVYHCQLSDVQQELYQSYAESALGELTKLVERDGFDKVQIHVLATLTRLKQICCHPAIFAKEKAEPGDSAKYDMLMELLQTLIEGGHKTVIFSQYTRMLQIMREDLEQRDFPHCYLDGSSKNRLEIIKQFNEDPKIPVFLVSLKAGGTGLNLTGADTVIHYDMWWNPAVENQATDRVHRLGQRNSVSAYKLITLGSIEEKIVEMQKRKKGLVKKVVSCDDEAIAKLTWEDVLELLQT